MKKVFALSCALVVTAAGSIVAHAAEANAIFVKGDKIECFDDVSGEVSAITFTKTSPLTAYIRFSRGRDVRFFSAKEVTVSVNDTTVDLGIGQAPHWDELITLSASIASGEGVADYQDRADSRLLDCVLKSQR